MNRRHRVAIICPDAGGAGSVASVARHHTARLSRFFDTVLISETEIAGRNSELKTIRIEPPSFDWLRRYGHVPREFAFARSAKRALIRLNEQRGLDFVVCHGHAVAALAAAPVKNSLGIRFGLVMHGDIFERPKGMYDSRLTWFYRCVTPIAYSKADLIIALSPHMQSLARQGGADEDIVRLIPNGVDPNEIGLDRNAIEPMAVRPGSPLRMLFVGRLSVEKGVDVLLAACGRLVSRRIPFELRIIGDGPLRKTALEAATELGLSDQVRFLETTPRSRLGSEYQWCDVVCVPSRSDSLPTVVIESMSAGRAVVGSDVGGISWSVENEKSGILVRPDDPIALADALERIAKDRVTAHSMGSLAQQRCLERFDWDRVIPQLAATIEETIEKK